MSRPAARVPLPAAPAAGRRWRAGDPVVLRGVWRGRLWWACAATVVRDDARLIAIYWPAGAPVMTPERRPVPADMLSAPPRLIPGHWTDTDVLLLARPGAAHSVWLMWEAGTPVLRCWYVNLEEPMRRFRLGFETMDRLLDLVLSPDRSCWEWKDEEEFRQSVEIGVFSSREAKAIRAEGKRVIAAERANRAPFRDGWERWRPPADWGIPDLPAGLEMVSGEER